MKLYSTTLIARSIGLPAKKLFDLLISHGLITKSVEKGHELTELGFSIGGAYQRNDKNEKWPVWPIQNLCEALRKAGLDITEPDVILLNVPTKTKPQTANALIAEPNYQREAHNLRNKLVELLDALGIPGDDDDVVSWLRDIGFVDVVVAKIGKTRRFEHRARRAIKTTKKPSSFTPKGARDSRGPDGCPASDRTDAMGINWS